MRHGISAHIPVRFYGCSLVWLYVVIREFAVLVVCHFLGGSLIWWFLSEPVRHRLYGGNAPNRHKSLLFPVDSGGGGTPNQATEPDHRSTGIVPLLLEVCAARLRSDVSARRSRSICRRRLLDLFARGLESTSVRRFADGRRGMPQTRRASLRMCNLTKNEVKISQGKSQVLLVAFIYSAWKGMFNAAFKSSNFT